MLNMHSGAAAIAAALFICALGGAPREALAAAQFSIEPLMVTLPAHKLASSLTLGNAGTAPVTVQAELISWNQDTGEDTYAPATGLVVSPPIFTLAAGAKQVVRIGRTKRGAAPEREVAYRIRLAEIAPNPTEKLVAIGTVIQLSLPIFVPPADAKARPAVEFKASAQGNRGLLLSFANPGLVHDKVTKVIASQDGKVLAERSLNYYLLAGAKRELSWPEALKTAKAGPVEVKVQLEGKTRFLTQTLGPVEASGKN
jgi:fimbrial chaperone protein